MTHPRGIATTLKRSLPAAGLLSLAAGGSPCFKLSNYFFGSMGVRFRDFFWGTLLGTLPLSFLLVYLGSLTARLATLEQGGLREHPWGMASLLGIGMVGMAGLAWMSRRMARAYRDRMDQLDLPVPWEREG